jgi:hypothetical protein
MPVGEAFFISPEPSRLAHVIHTVSYSVATGVLYRGWNDGVVKLTTRFHVAPRLTISGAIPLPSLYTAMSGAWTAALFKSIQRDRQWYHSSCLVRSVFLAVDLSMVLRCYGSVLTREGEVIIILSCNFVVLTRGSPLRGCPILGKLYQLLHQALISNKCGGMFPFSVYLRFESQL